MLEYLKQGVLLPEENVHSSFEEAPIDDSKVPDGDNSVLWISGKTKKTHKYAPHVPLGDDTSRDLFSSVALTASLIVPLPRILKKGASGIDVLAVQRALSRAKYRKWGTFTQTYGFGTVAEVTKFQHDHSLKVDGVYGSATHAKLKPFFDAYGANLMVKKQAQITLNQPRNLVVAAAMIAYNHRALIGYTQGPLRMSGVINHIYPPNYPRWGDCSSMITWYYFASHLLDPNGLHFNGEGYSGTLALHGAKTAIGSARNGDIFFYGPGFPYRHVTVKVAPGKCVSHGSSAGPLVESIEYRSDLNQARSYLK